MLVTRLVFGSDYPRCVLRPGVNRLSLHFLAFYWSSLVLLSVSDLCSVCARRPVLRWGIRGRPAARSRPGDGRESTPDGEDGRGCVAIGGLSRTGEGKCACESDNAPFYASTYCSSSTYSNKLFIKRELKVIISISTPSELQLSILIFWKRA